MCNSAQVKKVRHSGEYHARSVATLDGGTTTPLTVDFHEPRFASQLNQHNAATGSIGLWFELSSNERGKAESPMGPANPQALNRYSYVLNNPMRYTDPTGHFQEIGADGEGGEATPFDPADGETGRAGKDSGGVGTGGADPPSAQPSNQDPQPGESGRYGNLDKTSAVGDGLDNHHMPAKAAGWTSEQDGGAIRLTHDEHRLTRTYKGRFSKALLEDAGLSFRQVLYKEIQDVRSIVGSRYNAGLRNLIRYYEENFGDLMRK